MLARLFGSVALFYLSMITLCQCEKIEVKECPEAYFTISYVSVLASRENSKLYFGNSRAMLRCWRSFL